MKSYAVNILNFVQYVMPTLLRQALQLDWLRALVKPVQELNDDFVTWSAGQLYHVNHKGQVIYLQKLLNDKFDNTERRIIIEDAVQIDVNHIRQQAEQRDEIYLRRDSEATTSFFVRRDADYESEVDFKIIFPTAITVTTTIEEQARAWVDGRKAAGKKYSVENE